MVGRHSGTGGPARLPRRLDPGQEPLGHVLDREVLDARRGARRPVQAVRRSRMVGQRPGAGEGGVHRVVASDGSLGGYAGGLEMKSRLLRLEASPNGTARRARALNRGA